ncbi:MAG: hypothetical protein AAFZ18_17040 [Myxococcota bacterium]
MTRASRYAALAGLAARFPNHFEACPLAAAEHRVFSQNGEDGVLAALFDRLGAGRRTFVEFGIQDGREGNAVLLADVAGWSGLFLEPDPSHFAALEAKYRLCPRVHTRSDRITSASLDPILREVGLFDDLDLLSIDVDGDDYWIWRGSAVRPRVLVIEYNASLRLDPIVQPPHAEPWDGTCAVGASLETLARLGKAKGYGLVHAELAGVNAFFVREDLLSQAGLRACSAAEVYRPPNYGLEGRQHPEAERPDWVRVDVDGQPVITAS